MFLANTPYINTTFFSTISLIPGRLIDRSKVLISSIGHTDNSFQNPANSASILDLGRINNVTEGSSAMKLYQHIVFQPLATGVSAYEDKKNSTAYIKIDKGVAITVREYFYTASDGSKKTIKVYIPQH